MAEGSADAGNRREVAGVKLYVRGILNSIVEKFVRTHIAPLHERPHTFRGRHGPGEPFALLSAVMAATWVRREVLPHFDDHTVFDRWRGVARRALAQLRLDFCRVRGHHMVLRFEPERLWLHCEECGADSPGWRVDVDKRFARRS